MAATHLRRPRRAALSHPPATFTARDVGSKRRRPTLTGKEFMRIRTLTFVQGTGEASMGPDWERRGGAEGGSGVETAG
jgi:hypothetical protein